MAEISLDLRKLKFLILLVFLIAIFYFEFSVTLSSPIAFGDEALHTNIAKWIGMRRDYPVYMPQIGTTIYKIGFFRSPLFNILQGSFYYLFGFNDVFARFMVPFIALLTGLGVYVLVSKIYSQDVAIVASVTTMTVPSFITYSVLLYTDVLVVLFVSITILATILSFKLNRRKYMFLAGMFGALSILTDASGFTVIPFFALVILYHLYQKRSLKSTISFMYPAAIIFALVLAPFFVRNLVYYKTITCQLPGFGSSHCNMIPNPTTQYSFEGVLSSGPTSIEFFSSGILSYFSFSYGYVYFVPLFAVAGIALSAYRRELPDILVIIALISFFFVFYQSLPGRVEDMVRNVIASTSVVALLVGLYAGEIMSFLKKYNKQFIWAVIFFVLVVSYFNFQNRLTQLNDPNAHVTKFYTSFFDACTWAKTNLPQNSLILSFWTAPTVYNCERPAEWDFTDSADVILSQNVTLAKQKLQENGFTHIFVQEFSLTSQKISGGYYLGFIDMLNQNPNSFKIVYQNGPDLLTCVRQGGCDGTIIYQIIY